MVTILYIAPNWESIHISRRTEMGTIGNLGRKTMDTIETIRHAGIELVGPRPSGRRGFVGRLVHVVRSLARWIDALIERRRSRLALLEMTDEQLKDIGVSRGDAHREGIRPFWD